VGSTEGAVVCINRGGVAGATTPTGAVPINSSGVGGSDSPASVGTGISSGEDGCVLASCVGVFERKPRGGSIGRECASNGGDEGAGEVGAGSSVGTGTSVGVEGTCILLTEDGATSVSAGTPVGGSNGLVDVDGYDAVSLDGKETVGSSTDETTGSTDGTGASRVPKTCVGGTV